MENLESIKKIDFLHTSQGIDDNLANSAGVQEIKWKLKKNGGAYEGSLKISRNRTAKNPDFSHKTPHERLNRDFLLFLFWSDMVLFHL